MLAHRLVPARVNGDLGEPTFMIEAGMEPMHLRTLRYHGRNSV